MTFAIVIASLAALLFRPFGFSEYVYACLGALALLASARMNLAGALTAVGKGWEVYLFLVGMMALAEVARQEGLFEWIARLAVRTAAGSALRLFALVYFTGVVVTIFLSNDATAVVLTPAVYAATRKAEAEPAPHLFACAFIANAASFVLPISNPANLVMFREAMPSLPQWLKYFAAPSLLAIVSTFIVLACTQRRALRRSIASHVDEAPLTKTGRIAAAGLLFAALALAGASWGGLALGTPTLACGFGVIGWTCVIGGEKPTKFLSQMSWDVLPLVGALFIMVDALARTGLVDQLNDLLTKSAAQAPTITALGAGLVTGAATNGVNNLPLGLLAAEASANASPVVKSALLIGVDLGPNLSVTGSLATILWLTALRREGVNISAIDFLRIGLRVTPPALALALAGLVIFT